MIGTRALKEPRFDKAWLDADVASCFSQYNLGGFEVATLYAFDKISICLATAQLHKLDNPAQIFRFSYLPAILTLLYTMSNDSRLFHAILLNIVSHSLYQTSVIFKSQFPTPRRI